MMDTAIRTKASGIIAAQRLIISAFAATLDRCLTEVNSDYEAKRAGNATMKQLELITLKKGTFLQWMRQKGKVGGQNKVPRLHKDCDFVNQLSLLQI